MSGVCVIASAGELKPEELVIPEGAFIIAADAGLLHLRSRGICPDMTVGDFDSLGSEPEEAGLIVRHRPEKDDTDTILAVREALDRGFDKIIILGGLGGRPDHSLANIQTLAFIAQAGAAGYMVGEGCVSTVLKNESLCFSPEAEGTVSVFSMTTESLGVNLRGLKYPLTNYTLTSAFPLGVSNEFQGVQSEISVREGMLAVMWQGCFVDFNLFERTQI